MSFPASNQTVADGFTKAKQLAARLENVSTDLRDRSQLGPVSRLEIVSFLKGLRAAISQWQNIAAIPSIAAHAQTVTGDSNLDITTEFTNMVNAAIALADWIADNVPTDSGSGAALIYAMDANGNLTPLTYTSAQLTTFRTYVDAFLATIG